MARAIISPELTLLRSDGQWSKLYLAFFRPNTIYTAQLASAPSTNDRVYQIAFNTGVGTLADVKANMTLYVGTSAGAYDLGMCRIRKAPIAGTFYIGLTSEIRWNAGGTIHLTVVDDFDLWAKHATVADGVLAMDVDIGYSDQHSAFNPVPVLGSHAAVWLDESTVDVEFSGSDSWVIGSSISGYAWTAPGSSASSGMSTATPTITYDTPGVYRVFCVVTAANGKTTTGVRYVFVYDRDENQPATVFQLSQCFEDYETGGWMFDMTMEAEASLSEIRDRELVVLFAEDWYGVPPFQVKQSIGPIENRENIVCVGRIVGESIRWDREAGLVHFTVQGLHHWLNKIKAFPVELTFAGVAANWSEMPYLTMDRVFFHILYWHSTAIETMDFRPTNDTRYSADGKTIASTIWGQLDDLSFSKLFASPGVDRFGRLFLEIDPQMVPLADRDFPEVMEITDDDWVEAIDFQRVVVNDVSLILLNSREVNGAGTPVTRYSLSPGHVPLRHGEPEMVDGVLCSNQADSNAQAGLVLGWRTNQYPDVPVVLAQNNRMIDCFPRQVCAFEIAAGDTPRGVAFAVNLIPRRVTFYYDGDTGYFHSEVNFEVETFQQLATNGDIPDIDEIDMEVPEIPELPDLPDLPIDLPGHPPEGEPEGPPRVLVHDDNAGLIYTDTFDHVEPIWRQWNTGLTTAQAQNIDLMLIPTNKSVYVACTAPGEDTFLARAPYVGGTFEVLEDYDSISAEYGSADNIRVATMGCNTLVAEDVVYALSQAGENIKLFRGSGVTFTAAATFALNTNNGCALSYGLGFWMFTASGTAKILPPNASAVVRTEVLGAFTLSRHVRPGSLGRTIHWMGDANTLVIADDNATDWVEDVAADIDAAYLYNDKLSVDPTGQYAMTRSNTDTPIRSSDECFSWSPILSLDTIVNWYFENAGGSRWIAAGSLLKYSGDFGDTWVDKRGNILDIAAPFLLLNAVKVIQL